MTHRNDDGTLIDLQLEGLGLQLRPFSHDDLGLIEEADDDDFISRLTTVPSHYTPAEGAVFIDRQLGRRVHGEGWSLAIHDLETDRAVGQIGLWVGSLGKGRAEIQAWERVDGVAKDMYSYVRLADR